jgi:hypothetical protein
MAKEKPKLAQLLAVEPQVLAHYNVMVKETEEVFGKGEHFLMGTKKVEHFDTSQSHLDTFETKDMVTTVTQRLEYFFKQAFTKMVDTELQKDTTNQRAMADVIVDGKVLIEKVPPSALLNWENRLSQLIELLKRIPTLQPGFLWEPDPERNNVYYTKEPKISFVTKLITKPVVLYPATEQHPAQVKEVSEHVPIATQTQIARSGMWTSKSKADILSRAQALLAAVKKARQRANTAELVNVKAGEKMAAFILHGPAFEHLSEVDDERALEG